MACTPLALSTKIAHTRGRGAASQSTVGGLTSGVQGETKGAGTRRDEEEEAGDESVNDKEKQEDNDDDQSKSSNEEGKDTPIKPPAVAGIFTEAQAKTNTNEGMEGTADKDELFPCKVDAQQKNMSPGGAHPKGLVLTPAQADQRATGLEREGILVPHRRESIRRCMPRPTGLWSPGCLFP